jgi:hypothetical protein
LGAILTLQRGTKYCFVVVLVWEYVISQNTALLSNSTMLSAYCMIIVCSMQLCPAALPGSFARKLCLAALPDSFARQLYPAALPGSFARQLCLAALPGSFARQLCPAALPGSFARQPCPSALPGSLARQSRSASWRPKKRAGNYKNSGENVEK